MMNLDMLPASYLEKSSAGFREVAKLLVINLPHGSAALLTGQCEIASCDLTDAGP
jgi:hypothetical protein